MDHQRIEEQNVAEDYVAGKLRPEDEAWFEEHLLECRECRERVAWAEDFRGSFAALATVAAVETANAGARVGLFAWLARHGRAGLGLATVLLLVLLGGLLVEEGRLRRELAAARLSPSIAAAHPAPSSPAAILGKGRAEGAAERERLAAMAEMAAEGQRLRRELTVSRERGEDLARRLAALTRPQINTAIFSLGLVRGEEGPGRVLVGAEPAWIVLSLELPSPPAETYRATLVDARGRTLWQGEGLHPAADDTLVLALYSDLLSPGAYRLVLTAPGRPGPNEIPFEVARRPGAAGIPKPLHR